MQKLDFLATIAILVILGAIAIYFTEDTEIGDSIEGYPHVSDGDSLIMNDNKIRILGIDAPELVQNCGKIKCGEEAKRYLSKIIGHKKVVCNAKDIDKYQRWLAVCKIDTVDIGKSMIKNGYAMTFRNHYVDYRAEEKNAKRKNIGLWKHGFTDPMEYKRLNSY